MHQDVVVRSPEASDIPDLAALRWVWAPPNAPATPEALAEWADWLNGWMASHRDDVLCRIAVLDGRLIGMAWLAVSERVPNPGQRRRRTGDIQSVFVLPEHRGDGIGRRLVAELCLAADELGLPSVTVRSNAAAIAFYERLGFARPDLILERPFPGPEAR